jgi:hypothetical protein
MFKYLPEEKAPELMPIESKFNVKPAVNIKTMELNWFYRDIVSTPLQSVVVAPDGEYVKFYTHDDRIKFILHLKNGEEGSL